MTRSAKTEGITSTHSKRSSKTPANSNGRSLIATTCARLAAPGCHDMTPEIVDTNNDPFSRGVCDVERHHDKSSTRISPEKV
eukprot:423009-Amphidinium_carterae.1